MISKRREEFRQEIRRRQIEEKIKSVRRSMIMHREYEAQTYEKQQFVKQFAIILYNIRQNQTSHEYNNLLESLQNLKKLIHGTKLHLRKYIVEDQFQLIEEVSKVLSFVSECQQLDENYKAHLFQSVLFIVVQMTSFDNLTDQKIMNSLFVEAIIPYFKIKVKNNRTLENLFRILGNMLVDSQKLANCYTRLTIPSLSINLILSMDPKVEQKSLTQFIFFLKSYFQNIKAPQKLSNIEINVCLVSCKQILNYYLTQNLHNNTIQQIIEDTLKVLKEFLNFQLIQCNNPNIDIQKIIDLIPIRNLPINIKKQALYIIDSYVYLDKQDNVIKLVKIYKLLKKLFGVEDQLRYIALNIFANLALYPQLNDELIPHLQRIRLNLNLQPNRKQLYLFIFNYFSSQKFYVTRVEEQSLIKQLWNTPQTTQQILQIQAKIWFGLILRGYKDRPPLKILSAGHLEEVMGIIAILERQKPVQFCDEDIISQS